MSIRLSLRGVSKRFGETLACDDINLDVAAGEFVSLLGDSGCGKTTLLRIISGFAAPDSGQVLRDERDISRLEPRARKMGFVFQSYALFPTKTVRQNIRFSLDVANVPRATAETRVSLLAGMLEIGALVERYPHELSGGQQQRVALARALANEPDILLLDEPLSALDARIRVRLRDELRSIVDQFKVTAIYVTHDQEEAMALSDRIAVMRKGRIEQLDTPSGVYNRPASRFVATFIGSHNLIRGRMTSNGLERTGQTWPALANSGVTIGSQAVAIVRPEDISPSEARDAASFEAKLLGQVFLGATTRYRLVLPDGLTLIADRPGREPAPCQPGAVRVWRYVPERVMVYRDE